MKYTFGGNKVAVRGGNFHLGGGGYIPRGLEDFCPSVESRDEAPVGEETADEIPQKLKQFADTECRF